MFTMDSETKTMSIVKKDSAYFTITLENYTLKDGDKVLFTVASSLDLPKEDALISIEIDKFDSGVCGIQLTPQDTDLQPGTYLYDIQVSTLDGRVNTVVGPAKFKVNGGVSF